MSVGLVKKNEKVGPSFSPDPQRWKKKLGKRRDGQEANEREKRDPWPVSSRWEGRKATISRSRKRNKQYTLKEEKGIRGKGSRTNSWGNEKKKRHVSKFERKKRGRVKEKC